MIIRDQVKLLWQSCFEDTDEFVDLYFSQRFQDDLNYYIEEQGRVVCALQAIPYGLTYFRTTIPIAYVSGACTLAPFRRRGYMAQLLRQVHQSLYQKHIAYSTLIPANDHLWQYYRLLGYTTLFEEQYEWHLIDVFTPYDLLCHYTFQQLHSLTPAMVVFLQDYFADLPMSVQHALEDLQIIFTDLLLSGGELIACYKEGEVEGVAFCLKDETKMSVKQLASRQPEASLALINELMRRFQLDLCIVKPIEISTEGYPKGMGRVIDAYQMLSLYAAKFPAETHFIHLIEDDSISQNIGYYQIEKGKCRRVAGAHPNYVDYTIDELTDFLFKHAHPFMSLMLE